MSWLLLGAVVVLSVGALRFALRGGRALGTVTQRTVYEALHLANLAAPPLREGLSAASATRAIGTIHKLLGVRAVAIADEAGWLACDGIALEQLHTLRPLVDEVMASGRSGALSSRRGEGTGTDPETGAPWPAGVAVPLDVDGAVVAVLVVLDTTTSAGLLRLAGEVAGFISTQLAIAELDGSRRRAVQAELQFLRAQISPHFIYNSLTAIESFVRSDPDRARELLGSFADFIRYSFRSHDEFATVAEELRLVDIYLDFERARFGERIMVTLRVAPEVLCVRLPALSLQPIVENALRHGLESVSRPGHVSIDVRDADADALIVIEDDGAGMDPDELRGVLAGSGSNPGIGLRNVDERLRAVFGEEAGLLVETGRGAGTKVTLRAPKYLPSGMAA